MYIYIYICFNLFCLFSVQVFQKMIWHTQRQLIITIGCVFSLKPTNQPTTFHSIIVGKNDKVLQWSHLYQPCTKLFVPNGSIKLTGLWWKSQNSSYMPNSVFVLEPIHRGSQLPVNGGDLRAKSNTYAGLFSENFMYLLKVDSFIHLQLPDALKPNYH